YSRGVPNADPFRPQRLGPVSLFRSEHLSDALDPTGLRPFPTRTAGAIHRRASRAPRASFTHGRTREKETFVTETTANDTHARSGSLTALRLPQLQEIAAGLGIKGYRRLRKSDLIEAIKSAEGSSQSTGGAQAPTSEPQAAAAPQDESQAPRRGSNHRSVQDDSSAAEHTNAAQQQSAPQQSD